MHMSVDRLNGVLRDSLVAFWAPEATEQWNCAAAFLIQEVAQAEKCCAGDIAILMLGGSAARDCIAVAQVLAGQHAAGLLWPDSLLSDASRDRLRAFLLGRGLVAGILSADADLLSLAYTLNRARLGLQLDDSHTSLDRTDALQELTEDLGRLLGNSVVCEGLDLTLFAASPVGKDDDLARQQAILRRRGVRGVRQYWAQAGYMTKILHSDWPIKVPANPTIGYSGRVVMRIALDGEAFGFFTVADTARALGQQDYALMREAAEAAARLLSKRPALHREASQPRRDLLDEIVCGRVSDVDALRTEARALGWRADGRQQVLVIVIDNPVSLDGDVHQPVRRHGHDRARLTEIVRLEAMAVDPDMTCTAHGTSLVVLLNVDAESSPERGGAALDLAGRIVMRVLAFLPSVTVSVGVGRPVRALEQVLESFKQAKLAAHLATSVMGGNRAVYYDHLGVYRLLQVVKEHDFPMPAALQRLLDYDREHRTEHVETLAIYFATMGRLKSAGEQLGIHRRSVANRIARIQAIAGVNLDDPDQRLTLEVGIRLLRLGDIP